MAKKVFTDESLATLVDETKSYVDSAVSTKANSSHNHAASNITSGTLSSDRLPTVPITKGGTGATTAAAALTNLGLTATATELNKMDGVTATTAELNYVDGVTSNIQTQLDGKQATITGGASTIASSNLTASRALVSNSSGKVAVSAVTSTELGYLDGVTSSVQTQLDSKANESHVHNWNDIQNSPFGDGIESEVTLMSNQTVSMYGDGWYTITPVIELVRGVTYRVTFNEVTYETVAWVSPITGTVCIGNGEIYGGEDYGNWSAPFAFEYGNGTFTLYSNDFGDATFSIVKVTTEFTKLLVPIVNGGTGATDAETALANLGGVSMTKLWENASPDSTFAAQTISGLGCADYNLFLIILQQSTSSEATFSYFCDFGKSIIPFNPMNLESTTTVQWARRVISITSAGNFYPRDATTKSGLTGTPATNNKYLIPLRLYGLKGVEL